MILDKFLLEIKKLEVALSFSHLKGILNKHLCKNFSYENRMPVFWGNSNIEGD